MTDGTLFPYVLWNIEGANQSLVLAQNVTGETTPMPPSGLFCFPIYTNMETATRMLSALYAGAEILYPESYLQVVVPFLQGLNDIGQCGDMACEDAIIDMRRNVNWLQVKRCNNPEWENLVLLGATVGSEHAGQVVFDFDGNGLPDLTLYQNTYNQQFGTGLPVTSDDDRICRAAFKLANQFCSQFDLVMGQAEAVIGFTAGALQALLDLGVITALADDTIEFITSDAATNVIEFIASNAKTEQTVQKVAELLFCAIRESYPDDLDNVLNNIDFGIYAPIVDLVSFGKVQWGNFDDIANSVYDTLLGRNVAYMVLGYARSSVYAFAEVFGVYQSTQTIMLQALETAQFFDGRDCLGFPCMVWEHEVNFWSDDVDWDFKLGSAGLDGAMISGGQAATWQCPNCKRQTGEVQWFEIGTDVTYELTDIKFEIETGQSTCQIMVLPATGVYPPLYENNSCESGNREVNVGLPAGHKGLWIWVASNIIDSASYPPAFQYKITLKGTGENPFLTL